MARQLKKSYPLRLHISTLFLVLVLLACTLISALFYFRSKEMVARENMKLIDRIVSETAKELEDASGSPETLASILANSTLAENQDLASRLTRLPLLVEAMDGNPGIASIYLGYPNGEFFLFRRLATANDRTAIKAPEKAHWAVQSIDKEMPVQRQILFYDKDLTKISATSWQADYDPRKRDWYTKALHSRVPVRGNPYVFFTDEKLGLTLSRSNPGSGVVAGVDIRLERLSLLMRQYKITANTKVVLFGERGKLIAYEDPKLLLAAGNKENMPVQRRTLEQLGQPALTELHRAWQASVDRTEFRSLTLRAGGEPWLATLGQLKFDNGPPIFLGMVIPYLELTAEVREIRNQTALLALALILALIPITLRMARGIARPINLLAESARRISRFDFSPKAYPESIIAEVDQLDQAMSRMESTISQFLSLINSLASEQDFDKLLRRGTHETMTISEADAGFTYIVNEPDQTLLPGSLRSRIKGDLNPELLPSYGLGEPSEILAILDHGKRKISTLGELLGKTEFAREFAMETSQVVAIPLRNRQDENIGVLCLVYDLQQAMDEEEHQGRLAFIDALSGFTAVTLESRKMLQMQKDLLESFIKLIAGAIDSKSPYTGGHCQRVPVLTKLLAEKAHEATKGPFARFTLDDRQWEAIHIASWLHDCGKVTTPEYVVDKATKLETLYDRIHEVRMRFEVLKRDAHIIYYQELANGADSQQQKKRLLQEWQQLDEEFAFVAQCNLGGEYMAEDKIQRLEKIATRLWTRTLDDRIGISWEEQQRKDRTPAPQLPVQESLLADRKDHIYYRGVNDMMAEDNDYGFKLEMPKYLYNKGEIYNLSIARGTLSDEERYKINDHIVQTIIMLKKLPYPAHLASVPDIAGGHHEKIDGTGYPRKLDGNQMSIQAKIMVIADVFEALTASDRPYKKPKKLSEAITIMGYMVGDNHIDPELFRLFLSTGAYLEYARDHLKPEQLDEVDISPYL